MNVKSLSQFIKYIYLLVIAEAVIDLTDNGLLTIANIFCFDSSTLEELKIKE